MASLRREIDILLLPLPFCTLYNISSFLVRTIQSVFLKQYNQQVSSNGLIKEGERYTLITFPFLYPVQHFIIEGKDNTVCIPATI